ncbi:MAG: FAD-dependent oxidoreductase [Thermodesulfovibrionales bacterium]|nr:FAD-dependent oxidoreductase [Thermodesulfovibrionales bacterium]
MQKYDIIIIGAGISGLSFAHYCAKDGFKTLLLEKNEKVGGALHSHHFGDAGGFWIEMGAHTCYNSYANLIGIIEDCGILGRIIAREKVPFKMLVGNKLKSISSQLNFPELLLSIPNLFKIKKQGQSVESYYSKILGRTNFERVLAPALSAVISQKANDFPADMLFKRRLRRKDIIKKFTFSAGIQTVAASIASQRNIEIIKGKEALLVKHNGSLFEVVTESGAYESDSLALAVPAVSAARILKEAFPETAEKLSQIRVETVESMGVAVKRDLVSMPSVAGVIAVSDSFYSAVSRDVVKDDAYRGFTFHFKTGITSHEAKLTRISEVLGIRRSQIEHFVSQENLVPALKTGHNILVSEIDRSISKSRLMLTGNYFDGMAIEDCVTRSLKEFLRLKASHGG